MTPVLLGMTTVPLGMTFAYCTRTASSGRAPRSMTKPLARPFTTSKFTRPGCPVIAKEFGSACFIRRSAGWLRGEH